MYQELISLLEENKKEYSQKYAKRIDRLLRRANFEIDFILDQILYEPLSSSNKDWKESLKDACTRGQNFIEIYPTIYQLGYNKHSPLDYNVSAYACTSLIPIPQYSIVNDTINIGSGEYKIFDHTNPSNNRGWVSYNNGPTLTNELRKKIGEEFKVEYKKNNHALRIVVE